MYGFTLSHAKKGVGNINIRVDQWKTCVDIMKNDIPIRVIVKNGFPNVQVFKQGIDGGHVLVGAYPECVEQWVGRIKG